MSQTERFSFKHSLLWIILNPLLGNIYRRYYSTLIYLFHWVAHHYVIPSVPYLGTQQWVHISMILSSNESVLYDSLDFHCCKHCIIAMQYI